MTNKRKKWDARRAKAIERQLKYLNQDIRKFEKEISRITKIKGPRVWEYIEDVDQQIATYRDIKKALESLLPKTRKR